MACSQGSVFQLLSPGPQKTAIELSASPPRGPISSIEIRVRVAADPGWHFVPSSPLQKRSFTLKSMQPYTGSTEQGSELAPKAPKTHLFSFQEQGLGKLEVHVGGAKLPSQDGVTLLPGLDMASKVLVFKGALQTACFLFVSLQANP